MFPFGGSSSSYVIRPRPEWEIANIVAGFEPSYADATTVAERAIDIIVALGSGELEQGVFDRPQPVLYPVFPGPSFEEPTVYTLPVEDDEPEYVGIYGPRAEPTDWDDFYEKYKVLNPEPEEDVAFWDGVSAVVDVIQGQAVGGGFVGGPTVQAYAPMGAPVPSSFPAAAGGKVTVDTKTGKVTPCRRRRRRRLLTPTDLNDLAALKTIVGGGQSMNFAVMKAVRR